MIAKRISTDNAKPGKLFYFVANAVVYRRSDEKVLILQRAKTEKVFPGIWGMIGGKLEHDDFNMEKPDKVLNGEVVNFLNPIENLLKREVREEAGIEVKDKMTYLKSVFFVRPDEIPVILVVFIAEYVSGEVKLEEQAFIDHAWVNEQEISSYKCIPGMEDEVREALVVCRGGS
jgi:8-oxo-dGTP pyrophosphatase MutT (NUDIX family)